VLPNLKEILGGCNPKESCIRMKQSIIKNDTTMSSFICHPDSQQVLLDENVSAVARHGATTSTQKPQE
jgi:hypothetical protein